MFNALSRIALICLVVVLCAPALKVRFELTDLAVYYLPSVLFGVLVLLLNLLMPMGIPRRFAAATFLGLPLLACGFGFLVGYAGESNLLVRVFLNCLLGAAVALFPWNNKSFTFFMIGCTAIGLVLSVQTILFFQGGGSESLNVLQEFNSGRLSVSFALGVGVIAAFYLTINQFSPITFLILGVCWVGLVLGLSRGPILFGALSTGIYMIYVLRSKVVNFGRGKKLLAVIMMASLVPIVVWQLLSVEQNVNRFTTLFFYTSIELEEGGRGDIWRDSIARMKESPVFGNGLGSYEISGGAPHNVFLQYGEDAGLVGISIIAIFFILISIKVFRAIALSDSASANMVFASGALFLYMVLNYSKSLDAYIGREIFILSALPLAVAASVSVSATLKQMARRKSRRYRPVDSRPVDSTRKNVPSEALRERQTEV